jgi:hypothetical protein
MASSQRIEEIVSSFLSGGDADKFMLDFSSAAYSIRADASNPFAIELVNKIESKMMAVHSKHSSISDFRDYLRALVNPFVTNVSANVIFSVLQPVNFQAEVGMVAPAWAAPSGTSHAAESESEHRRVPR